MGFVTQPLGLGDGEKALVDWPRHKPGRDRDNNRGTGGRPDFQFAATLRPIAGDHVLAAAIVAGRPRNRGRIVRMQSTQPGVGRHGDRGHGDSGPREGYRERCGQGLLGCCRPAAAIELETERSTEGGGDEVSRYEIFVRSITIYSNFIRLNRNH